MSLYLKRAIIILIVMLFAVSYLTVRLYKREARNAMTENSVILIIDAGHGEPDGGAVGGSGAIEAELNLKISKKLSTRLSDKGYNVIMTRRDEKAVAEGSSVKEIKKNDMYKRADIMNSSGAAAFISIHMNKFTEEKYHGAQVFHSPNNDESGALADRIQKRLREIDETNEREIKKADRTIFLLSRANLPAVIVECGFLSNIEEEKRLMTEHYQEQLAEAICLGIEDFLEVEV